MQMSTATSLCRGERAREDGEAAAVVDLLLSGSWLTSDHLAQLEFLGKLAAQLTEVLNEVLAGGNHNFLWCDLAVGLNAKLKGGNEWVRNFVTGEGDVWGGEEAGAKEVGESVVFLVEGEDGGVGGTWEDQSMMLRSTL